VYNTKLKLKFMKLLITGGAGFIGSNFVHYWLQAHPKDKIRVIDALTYAGNYENLRPIERKIEFVRGDITNRTQVRQALKGVETVVHFAAESHVDRSIFDPLGFWKTNVEGTRTLLEEAKRAKVDRFHHISTDEVYGELPRDSTERFNEDTPYAPRPDNFYAISKAEADRVVREFYKDTGMFITISNCSNNYGPFQFPEKFVPLMITNLIDGFKAPVHGDGQHVRDWIHTHDHATAVDLILKRGKPGETYLIGSQNDRPNKYVAERVVSLYGKDEGWIRYVPDRHSNDRRYAIDATKIIEELGWKPEVSRDNFDEGLRDTISWYRKNENWWRPLLEPLLEKRALISDRDKKIFAYMSLDREVGKTKLIFNPQQVEDKTKGTRASLEEKLMTEENERRFELIKNKLKTRAWFKETDAAKRKELMSLARNPRSAGFVEDLANRPDVIGKEKQVRLIKLEYAPKKYPVYGIAAWFEVQTESGEKLAEAIYSWGMGPKSGVRFLVLVRQKGKITHLALLKDDRFPMGARVYGLAGGFPTVNESVFELILRKLTEDLGIEIKGESMKIGEMTNLGRVMPDAGMTNNHPLIYVMTLDISEKVFPPIRAGVIYDDPDEDVVIWPIERLSELVNKVDDSYFLAALARLTLGGVSSIKLS
jgi:dTDP-glucose 4,6-dehydratase